MIRTRPASLPIILRILFASVVVGPVTAVGFASPASAASGWTSVSSGYEHTCGIRQGRVYCWGSDEFGQLGDGAAGASRATPAPISSNATDWTAVSAGSFHTCAIRAGRVACWGKDNSGQLGDGTVTDTPDPTPGIISSAATDWTSVSSANTHTCAIRTGRVACWGADGYGQLGDGTATSDMPDPTPGFIASGATDWTSVTTGLAHTCATRAGRIACWGYDQYGQLGDGTPNGSNADPTPGFISSGATDWTAVAAGHYHTCGIRAGRVACWGYDEWGQLGDGTAGTTYDPTPSFISSGATDWQSVSAGHQHTCAMRSGRVACWGNDQWGQLGDGTKGPAADPTPGLISSNATDWTSAEVGNLHSCAIRATLLACWGYDNHGQVGDGTPNASADPTPNLVS